MATKIPKTRNSLEEEVAKVLIPAGFKYEHTSIGYTLDYFYTPDFTKGQVHFETKGKFDPDDRRKMLHLRNVYPDEIVVMIFQNANKKIRKNSMTTYGGWCTKNNIPWMDITKFREEHKQCLLNLMKPEKDGLSTSLPTRKKRR